MKKPISRLILVTGTVFSNLLHRQTASLSDSSVDYDSLSDLEVEVKAVEMTTPLPASAATQAGNYYSTQHLPGTDNE